MAYCPNCGNPITPGAAFCASCGAALSGVAVTPAVPVMPAVADHSLVLVSTGSCPRSQADDVLEDLLGYTNAEANQIVRMIPTQIAQGLTAEQACYIAQALTEYGMQIAIYQGANMVDYGQYATGPVFNSDGTFVAGAMAALGALTVANRIAYFSRWDRPYGLFAPHYRPPMPPPHIRRPLFGGPRPPRHAPPPPGPGRGPGGFGGPGPGRGPGGPGGFGGPGGGHPGGGPGGPGGGRPGGGPGGPGGGRPGGGPGGPGGGRPGGGPGGPGGGRPGGGPGGPGGGRPGGGPGGPGGGRPGGGGRR